MPNRNEPHQHQSPTMEDPNPGPATNLLQVQQPDPISHKPIAPTTREDDINLETPPTRIHHYKYPLRHRESKRQWEESLQSTATRHLSLRPIWTQWMHMTRRNGKRPSRRSMALC